MSQQENKNDKGKNINEASPVDQETKKIFSSFRLFLTKSFKKELEEDIELEKKYKQLHSEEEINSRKQLQEKFRFFQRTRYHILVTGLHTVFKWLYKNYFWGDSKDTYERYEYSKYLKTEYFKLFCVSMFKSTIYTFLLFLWMRLLKHKSSKDLLYLLLMQPIISMYQLNINSYNFLAKTRLPLNSKDLDLRKELLEELSFSVNRTQFITCEIKKISALYLPEKIEFSFVTAYGQKVTFTSWKGRLYLSCDNYAEVFGYIYNNKLTKLESLNINNPRERELIIGLIKFYELLESKYIEKFNLQETEINFKTQLFQEIVEEKNLTIQHIDTIKKSKTIKEVEFEKLHLSDKNSKIQNEIIDSKKKDGKLKEPDPKFFI